MEGGQAPVNIGDVLADKYRVERILGVGGMGVVVAATHLQLEQLVALKFMLPHALANYEAVQRFLREARNAVKLKSEHVARIIDVGTLPNTAPYIVMEYLQGTDLQTVLERQGPVPVQTAVDFILQACEAIAEAHAHNIVHRDLKPANLFLTRRPDGGALVKVLDFGISKAGPGHSDFNMTQTAAVMGSPAYMSPEQMRSSKLVDQRSDIWALGVILFQVTTGHVPFQGETFTELCLKVAIDPCPPMPAMPYAVAPGFEAVIRRCLEKDPAMRPQNVAELAQLLAPFGPPHAAYLAERATRVLLGESAAQFASQPGHDPNPSWNRSRTTLGSATGQSTGGSRSSSKKGLIFGGVLAIGGIGGIIAAVAMTGGDTPAPTEVAKPAAAAVETKPPEEPAPAPKVVIPTIEVKPPPVAETKPAEPPPVAETKPAEPPPAETKPAEPVAAEKPRRERTRTTTKVKPPPTTTTPDKPKPPPAYDPLNSPD